MVEVRGHSNGRWAVVRVTATLVVGSAAVFALTSLSGGTDSAVSSAPQSIAAPPTPTPTPALGSRPALYVGPMTTARAPATAPAPAPAPTTAPSTVRAAAAAAAATPPVTEPPIATLVAEIEASGLEPGSNWTWTIGDPSTHCGVMSGAGTGCTYGEAGREYTIFAGTPTLALVAHELGNAETQNDAIPSLLSEVATAAAGTSWSPTDAVASCLVAHFMGFQDNAAGSWQCPAPLAAVVADHIHDTY
jgi:hypothetical protein